MTNPNQFPLISGHLSLDIVNTEVVRRGVRHNLLTSKKDLMDWIKAMQDTGSIVPEQISSENSEWNEEALDCVLTFRQFLREGFEHIADGYQPLNDWIVHLEKLIAKAPFLYRLIDGKLVAIPVGKPLDGLVSLIAFDVLNLQTTGELSTIKRCANPDCVLLFMDSSGRRKWCSMQICGNRKKVSRFHNRSEKKNHKGND